MSVRAWQQAVRHWAFGMWQHPIVKRMCGLRNPPASFGPELARSWRFDRSELPGAFIGTLFVSALLLSLSVIKHGPISISLWAILVYYLIFPLTFRTALIRAGSNWVSYGNDFVRTDRLKKVKFEYKMLRGMFVTFRDTEKHEICVSVDELTKNPAIDRLIIPAVALSVERGLTTRCRNAARCYKIPLVTKRAKASAAGLPTSPAGSPVTR